MTTELNRRRFLQASTATAATVTMPSFLAACSRGTAGPSTTAVQQPASQAPLFAWFGIDEALIRKVMAELSAQGADHADLYFQHSAATAISYEDGIISRASSELDLGVGLRAVVGDQVGYAYTEELTLESMMAAARTASAIAKGTNAPGAPAHFQYAEHRGYYKVATPWSDVGVEQRLPVVRKAAELGAASDPSIQKVSIDWTDSEERVLIADLAGNIVTDVRPMTRMWVRLTATRNGVTQTNASNISARQGIEWYTDERIGQVVKEARDRTMILFDAVRPEAGEMPVVLAAGASGILLHEAIGHGLEADFNRKGASIYADMLGRRIAPEFVNIVDDGTLPNERGSLSFDDEGMPCERSVLVDKGVLRTYIHDRISANHYKTRATGSGRRQSFRYAPMPRMRATYMTNGPHTRDEIIASVDKGIIAETFTNGQVDIGPGDYTFYIKNGWLIEKGKVTAPLKDVNIIGNGPESLRRVTMVGNDFKLDTGGWTCGKRMQGVPVSIGLPTALVSKMTVGGNNA